jgi:hypothetical protein
MLTSNGLQKFFIAFFLISLGTATQSKGQENANCANQVYNAQKFLQVFYPEATGQHLAVIFSVGGTYDGQWTYLPRLEVTLVETNETPSLQQLYFKKNALQMSLWDAKLAAYFDFDVAKCLEAVSISGDDLANDKKNARVAQIIRTHRVSSSGQIERIFRQAGAKYGPEDKEAFLKSMPLQDLQKFLGVLSVKSVEFYNHTEQIDGTVIELRWRVELDAKGFDERPHHYTLICEPFSGKVISLRRAIEIPQ